MGIGSAASQCGFWGSWGEGLQENEKNKEKTKLRSGVALISCSTNTAFLFIYWERWCWFQCLCLATDCLDCLEAWCFFGRAVATSSHGWPRHSLFSSKVMSGLCLRSIFSFNDSNREDFSFWDAVEIVIQGNDTVID